ncbi:hypothetical protein GE061_012986 [Apolygus lucorum]|uniref:Uncharacterized protein n=1 Tax=Apolygus lucorum TaxID=248454 RepID=A0A6A4JTS6_APOLU|nr:hypothetical protein GE061_012986 [Apolygus lucorum]
MALSIAVIENTVLRRAASMLGEIASSALRPSTQDLPVLAAGSDGGLLVAPSILWAGPDDCEKTEKKAAKKLGPVCRAPDLRKKPIPPYVYGYCKEPEPELPMSCPPKSTKKRKGPCCLNEEQSKKKGGCQSG